MFGKLPVTASVIALLMGTVATHALDLGVSVGGIDVGVSVGSEGVGVEAEVGEVVEADTRVSSEGVSVEADVAGGAVAADASVGGGEVTAGVSAGPVAVDASAGSGGVSAGASVGPVSATAAVGSDGVSAGASVGDAAVGAVAGQGGAGVAVTAPGSALPIIPADQVPALLATPAQPQATPPVVRQVVRQQPPPRSVTSFTTLGGERRVSTISDPEARLDQVLDVIGTYAYAGKDLDRIVNDRRVVIIYLDELLEVASREKVYRAIRSGATGYAEVISAIEDSREVKEVLSRNKINYADVIGIQVTLDGTTEILVSERARLILTAQQTPVDLEMFTAAYFPASPGYAKVFTPERLPVVPELTVRLQGASGGDVAESLTCSVLAAGGTANLGDLTTAAWQGEAIGTVTAIPGWDMNGVALMAAYEDDMALFDSLMQVLGAPVEESILDLAGGESAEIMTAEVPQFYSDVFADVAEGRTGDLIVGSHVRAEVAMASLFQTEEIVGQFEPPVMGVGGFDLAAATSAPDFGCDPQTGQAVAQIGSEDLRWRVGMN